MEKPSIDILIIGGGIIGAATMYQFQKRYKHLNILLLEKEKSLAEHQTGRNSGVIHSGIYYKPGSQRALLCRDGRKALVNFAKEHHVPHDICGKTIVATSEGELSGLNEIYERGIANQTEGIELIDKTDVLDIEPYCESAVKAIWVPCAGIIDYAETTKRFTEIACQIQPRSRVNLNETFISSAYDGTTNLVVTDRNKYNAKYLIFCGGLQADSLAKTNGIDLQERVVGFRGDYYDLSEPAEHKIKNLVYPVPNPELPFLGVHFTKMVHGGVECGPNAVFSFKREGYNKLDFSFKDTVDALRYKGTWKFFSNHIQFGISEYRRAFSKRIFLNTLQKIVPSLTMDDIVASRSGVRAILLQKDGSLIDGFVIKHQSNSVHVVNAPSPAATSALAISETILSYHIKHYGIL
ncbi:MAG: L-2-hydroxyglutarate oxidase [Bacteroidota bacterium]